jgi:hypothetical protein
MNVVNGNVNGHFVFYLQEIKDFRQEVHQDIFTAVAVEFEEMETDISFFAEVLVVLGEKQHVQSPDRTLQKAFIPAAPNADAHIRRG